MKIIRIGTTPGNFRAVLVVEENRALGEPIPSLLQALAKSVPPTHCHMMTNAQAPITATGGVALKINLPARQAITPATNIQIAKTNLLLSRRRRPCQSATNPANNAANATIGPNDANSIARLGACASAIVSKTLFFDR